MASYGMVAAHDTSDTSGWEHANPSSTQTHQFQLGGTESSGAALTVMSRSLARRWLVSHSLDLALCIKLSVIASAVLFSHLAPQTSFATLFGSAIALFFVAAVPAFAVLHRRAPSPCDLAHKADLEYGFASYLSTAVEWHDRQLDRTLMGRVLTATASRYAAKVVPARVLPLRWVSTRWSASASAAIGIASFLGWLVPLGESAAPANASLHDTAHEILRVVDALQEELDRIFDPYVSAVSRELEALATGIQGHELSMQSAESEAWSLLEHLAASLQSRGHVLANDVMKEVSQGRAQQADSSRSVSNDNTSAGERTNESAVLSEANDAVQNDVATAPASSGIAAVNEALNQVASQLEQHLATLGVAVRLPSDPSQLSYEEMVFERPALANGDVGAPPDDTVAGGQDPGFVGDAESARAVGGALGADDNPGDAAGEGSQSQDAGSLGAAVLAPSLSTGDLVELAASTTPDGTHREVLVAPEVGAFLPEPAATPLPSPLIVSKASQSMELVGTRHRSAVINFFTPSQSW